MLVHFDWRGHGSMASAMLDWPQKLCSSIMLEKIVLDWPQRLFGKCWPKIRLVEDKDGA